jgi:SAM-dependent methyltransferase
MNILPRRIASLATYLKNYADSPFRWRIGRGLCPVCGPAFFIALHPSGFMTRCLSCRSNITNLALIPVIQRHFGSAGTSKSAYELSTYGGTLNWLTRNFGQVTTSEYIPGSPFGQMVNGILNQDVQQLTFADETFDLVTSSQVFEHVPDDLLGFRECLRVLRPGGAMIMSVPFRYIPHTEQRAFLNADGSIQFIGEPEYHDSRLGGPRSAPVFWHHSVHDVVERVRSAGFSRAELAEVMVAKVQGTPELVIYACK